MVKPSVSVDAAAHLARLGRANASVRTWTFMSSALIGGGIALIGIAIFRADHPDVVRAVIGGVFVVAGMGLSLVGARRKAQYLRDHPEGT